MPTAELSETFGSQKSGQGLLDESVEYKPFRFPWAMEKTMDHEKIHWVEDEADLSEDVAQWKGGKLKPHEVNYITQILRLFTQSDVAVGSNYYNYFLPRFKNNEVRNMLGSFACREGIHQRAYALLNDTLGLPDSDYHAFMEYQEMADKIDFMTEGDPNTPQGLALALAKSVFNEGVALFASFVMLLNFQRFGKMKGMCTIVEWSVRDETMHVLGIAKLFEEFCREFPQVVTPELHKQIREMAAAVVGLEEKFIDLAYELGGSEGLTADEVKQYIRYITDRRLGQLGLEAIYGIESNPLPWLDWILNGADHSNFFEKRVSEYNVSGMEGDWGWQSYDQPAVAV